jgi:cation/acetate symporter
MLSRSASRFVNPRLGTYYAIFASLMVALVLVTLMFEQLGLSDALLRGLMFAVPIALYAAFGFAATTNDGHDYFTAGRRVTSFFSGIVIAISTIGGVGLVCLTGTMAIVGFDGIALLIGWVAGLVFMAVLLTPFLRKVGAHTVPGYLGARFESRLLRVVAAAVLSVPTLLLLVAEVRIGGQVATLMVGQPLGLMSVVVVFLAALMVAGGGMRAFTWTAVAKAIAALLAIAVLATVVSMLVSNLPLPQMTHGNLLRNVARIELTRGAPTLVAPALLFDMPGIGLEPLSKRYLQAFGSIGSVAFSLTVFVILAGIAGMPTMLARSGVATSVYEARKSMGWAVLITTFVLLTLASIAAFLRGYLADLIGLPGSQLPVWFQALQQYGWADVASKSSIVTLGGISLKRDATLFALAVAGGLPSGIVYLVMAGALAAALAAATAGLTTLAAILAEDVLQTGDFDSTEEPGRVGIARMSIGVVAIVVAAIALLPSDPLDLAFWGLGLSASASFPVLILSVLWKRLNAAGAIAGLITGTAVAVGLVLIGEAGLVLLDGPLAAVVAMPTAVVAAVVATRLTAPVSRTVLEFVRDMRVPGGETMLDRRRRIARMKAAALR